LTPGQGREIGSVQREAIKGWLARARRNYQDLLALMDAIHERPVPAPSGAYESLVEYNRRNAIKEQLLGAAVGTCLETALAVGSMQGVVGSDVAAATGEAKRPRWEPPLLQLEQALWRGDVATARSTLQLFLEHFQREPLLFTPLGQGGQPRLVLRASIAQTLLRALVANLPRLGLLQETYGLLRIAQTMEREQILKGLRTTEYHRLFQIAFQASVETVVISTAGVGEAQRIQVLEQFVQPFFKLWTEHTSATRFSVLETVQTDSAWASLQDFIRKYGGGLFNNGFFMAPQNLHGVLQRGVGAYLQYLQENPDPQNPIPLVEHLDHGISLDAAARHLQTVLQAVLENFEEFKDYNSTTTQSDQGENFYILLDFLRLKALYARQAWQIMPLLHVHEVLVKHSLPTAALWQQWIERKTQAIADDFAARLAELEKRHGLRLRTVGDRIRERFVQALALDRVSALIEPAYDAARAGQPAHSVAELEAGLQAYLDAPTGSGLDVPAWVQRLEGELRRVQLRRTAIANLTENLLQVPRVALSVLQLRAQMEDWPKP
jgi:hypothetical protein